MPLGNSLSFLDLDIYSRRISFFYKGKEKIGSKFGFFLTSLYIIISLSIFLMYFIGTIRHEEVTASDSNIYTDTVPSFDITPENFNLAFGIEHPKQVARFIDETIYYPKVNYIENIKQNGIFVNKITKEIEAKKCSNEIFGKDHRHLLSKDELNNSYCLYNFDYTLKGGYKYDEIGYIKISIFPCINGTNNKTNCKSKEIIDQFFNNNHFSLLMKDTALSPRNYSFPGMPILLNSYTSIDKSLKKDYIIKLAVTEIETDTGLFYDDIRIDRYLKYTKELDQFFLTDNDYYLSGKELLSLSIRLEDNIYFQKRTYKKMAEVFATTGGYMQMLYSLFGLITLLTKKLNVEKRLLNNLFYFDIKRKKVILSIEYKKKLVYNLSEKNLKNINNNNINKNLSKNVSSNFIPYLAKKSSFYKLKKSEKDKIVLSRPKSSVSVINNNNETKDFYNKIINGQQNDISQENLIDVLKINKNNKNKLTLYGQKNNINISKNYNKEDKLNKMQMDRIYEHFNVNEKDKYIDINLNLFDYYCLCKNSKKKTEIELFGFAVKFYKSQLDIINIFNLIILTQIMMKKQSDGKKNFLSKFVELSI